MDLLPYNKNLKPLSRNLRKKQTPAEKLLWSCLRKKQLLGICFNRQKPIGPYIVDFYAKEKNLVVELDGSQHYEEAHQKYDQQRDDFLRVSGVEVLRFNNLEVLRCTETVVQIIKHKIEGNASKLQYGEFIKL